MTCSIFSCECTILRTSLIATRRRSERCCRNRCCGLRLFSIDPRFEFNHLWRLRRRINAFTGRVDLRAFAKLHRRNATKPLQILRQERFIKTEAISKSRLCDSRISTSWTATSCCSRCACAESSWRKGYQAINHKCHPNQCGNHQEQSTADVRKHRCLQLVCRFCLRGSSREKEFFGRKTGLVHPHISKVSLHESQPRRNTNECVRLLLRDD